MELTIKINQHEALCLEKLGQIIKNNRPQLGVRYHDAISLHRKLTAAIDATSLIKNVPE